MCLSLKENCWILGRTSPQILALCELKGCIFTLICDVSEFPKNFEIEILGDEGCLRE